MLGPQVLLQGAQHSMKIEEKIGQLFMVSFNGEEANEEAQILIQQAHIGGVIYYSWANGLHNTQQISTLSSSLQALAQIPLLIAIDQEGGRVERLKNGFTTSIGNLALANLGNEDAVQNECFIRGKELLSVGINLNLAPVVDINSNPNNPIIGSRSFGNRPETVVQFANKALEGYRQSQILTCLKHFPGHGDVDIDSHLDLPILHKTKNELDQCELIPFIQLASKTDLIMTAHLKIPSIDPDLPSTFSSKIISILRNEIQFNGVIITDSLTMQGALSQMPIEQTAIKAFQAGCDILLFGGGLLHEKTSQPLILKIIQTFREAVDNKIISEERIDQSLSRIFKLKQHLQHIGH